jgi:hypothetical protein
MLPSFVFRIRRFIPSLVIACALPALEQVCNTDMFILKGNKTCDDNDEFTYRLA